MLSVLLENQQLIVEIEEEEMSIIEEKPIIDWKLLIFHIVVLGKYRILFDGDFIAIERPYEERRRSELLFCEWQYWICRIRALRRHEECSEASR